jgi:hypothetical protein
MKEAKTRPTQRDQKACKKCLALKAQVLPETPFLTNQNDVR